ncbi:MAG: signal peptidase II [Sporichthyaceae bacterium]
MTTQERPRTAGVRRTRIGLLAVAASLAVLDLGLKAWAERGLDAGQSVDLKVIQLRLLFNPGISFGLGDTLPTWVVLVGTGLITAGIGVFAWRLASTTTLAAPTALAVILAGALSNLVDRVPDGVVTDYLHTGWFPTFNGADVLITLGAIGLGLAALRGEDRATQDREPDVGGGRKTGSPVPRSRR